MLRVAVVAARRVGARDWRLAWLLLAGLTALPLASRPLANWAANLPDWAQPAQGGLVWWDATMERAGLTTPYDVLHRWVRDAVARSF